MFSRAARGAAVQGRVNRAVAEALESRRLLSVTNLIEGIDLATARSGFPPDPNGAVGPNHVVNAVNTSIQWFTKSGTPQKTETFADFFAPLGPVATDFMSDPHVIYDQYSGRFVVGILALHGSSIDGALTNESHFLIAVSQTSDPNGGWYYQDLNTRVNINGVDSWSDYPGLGVSQDAIYFTGNMFSFSGSSTTSDAGGYEGTRLWIIPKAPFYSGGGSVNSGTLPLDPVSMLKTQYGITDEQMLNMNTLQPAHMWGGPAGVGDYFLINGPADANGNERLYALRLDNPISGPSFHWQEINVGDISSGVYNGVPQPWAPSLLGPTLQKLDSIDARIFSSVWRNGSLYATQEVIPTTGPEAGQMTAHWYKIDTGLLPFDNTSTYQLDPAHTTNDQGNVGGEDIGNGVQTFFPAVAVNGNGDMAIGFSASSPTDLSNGQTYGPTITTIYPSAYVTARMVSDPKGTTRQSVVLAQGQALFSYGSGVTLRWGDYSGVAVDPADDQTFWAFNMYAKLPTVIPGRPGTTNNWGTRWGHFTAQLYDLPAVGNVVWDDLNGNGIQDAGEPGIAGVAIRLVDSNGNVVDSTTSDATGHWMLEGAPTGQLAAGTGFKLVADISASTTTTDPFGGSTTRYTFDGYSFSPALQGSNADVDSDFVADSPTSMTATTAPFNLAANSFIENVDLGLYRPFVHLSGPSTMITEGNNGSVKNAQFTVSLWTGVLPNSGAQQQTTSPWNVNVYYSTVALNATPDVDYTSRTNELLVIPPLQAGQTQQVGYINVPIYGNNTPQPNRSFEVELTQPSVVLATDPTTILPGSPAPLPALADGSQMQTSFETAMATIKDDDVPLLSVDSGPTVTKASSTDTYALFTVRLSVPNPYATPVTVNYTLSDGTAIGTAGGIGGDYDNTPGSITFAPGQLTRTVRVKVTGGVANVSSKTFTLNLSIPSGTALGASGAMSSTATIVDLGTSTLAFSAKKVATYKDLAGNTVTLTLTGPGTGSVTKANAGEGRQLVLDGTTEKSTLVIRTSGGQTSFTSIQVNGAGLGTLDGRSANLTGSLISLGAIRMLNLNFVSAGTVSIGPSSSANTFVTMNIGRVADSNISSDTAIKTFSLGTWADFNAPADVLSAPSITTVRASGDFGGSITTGDLGSLTVNGNLKGATISAARTIKSLVAGSILQSHILTAASAGDVVAGSIGSLTARKLFSDSTINTQLINTLDLGTVQNTGSSVLRAATADRISSVRWVFAGKQHRITGLNQPGDRGLDRSDASATIVLHMV